MQLDCPDHRIAVQRYAGHNYEAYGCDRAMRYTCQSRVCTSASEALPATTDAMRPLVTRTEQARTQLSSLGGAITARCSGGQPFSATLTINPKGKVTNVATPTGRESCLAREVSGVAFPPGSGALQLTHVFR
ncbi:MAG: hypothetical protein KF901_31355 [Myxococcales bacterium]|nr:hypothetical protein [Myxococcales bacterium]